MPLCVFEVMCYTLLQISMVRINDVSRYNDALDSYWIAIGAAGSAARRKRHESKHTFRLHEGINM